MIETKQVLLPLTVLDVEEMRRANAETQQYISDLTAFGWQKTQETSERHGRTTRRYQILARETTMLHYVDYRKFESEYESAKSRLKTYEPMEFGTACLLLLLFVIPGAIYITFKTLQKKKIEENNDNCTMLMKHAVYLAKKVQ